MSVLRILGLVSLAMIVALVYTVLQVLSLSENPQRDGRISPHEYILVTQCISLMKYLFLTVTSFLILVVYRPSRPPSPGNVGHGEGPPRSPAAVGSPEPRGRGDSSRGESPGRRKRRVNASMHGSRLLRDLMSTIGDPAQEGGRIGAPAVLEQAAGPAGVVSIKASLSRIRNRLLTTASMMERRRRDGRGFDQESKRNIRSLIGACHREIAEIDDGSLSRTTAGLKDLDVEIERIGGASRWRSGFVKRSIDLLVASAGELEAASARLD